MWNDFIKNTLLKPLLERLGTAGAAVLVTGGDWLCAQWSACGLVTPDGATEVVKWVIAAALVAFDLALAFANRKRAGRK
jgi:hypothetical protein